MIYSRLESLWWFPSATADCWASYRHARNEVMKLLRKAEAFYSKERFAESKDCKSFRKTVSDAFGKHRPGKIEALKGTNDEELVYDNDKVERLQTSFIFQKCWKEFSWQVSNWLQFEPEHVFRITFSIQHLEFNCTTLLSDLKNIKKQNNQK